MLPQLLFASVLGCALAAPTSRQVSPLSRKSTCTNPLVRKAWHTLTPAEKKAYIDAELCLMNTPGNLGLRGAKSKYDEFQAVHVYQSEIAHGVGQFFPFHRLYLHAHELTLRSTCNYTGTQPYWDETLDAGSFSTSSVLADFGGDGLSTERCISPTASPFGNIVLSIGPGYRLSQHCIQRSVSDPSSLSASPAFVADCLSKETYLQFWACAEARPHSAGHGGVGAQMMNPVSSPGDPLFYLHHAFLDKIWADWQAQEGKREQRLKEIGGNNRPVAFNFTDGPRFPPPTGGEFPGGGVMPPMFGGPGFGEPGDLVRPADVPEPIVMGDNGGNTTTLNQVMQMYGIVPNQTIAEIMDIQGDVLCYEYE
ncbi:hypothetical protein QBC35DRAFT_533872 [Podospora australis]|uniref:Tyrosinase copper-binding domain-containing protein n=1 Tax=Podospora australis TaxID=1536484 RepID=A0AAN6WQW7_9PEZI|nr:hypothetical protein QBC35DRAFT_533872 [Podospora australis]